MFFQKSKQRLAEALDEIESLRFQLAEAQRTIDHLRHIADLKAEECGELSSRIARMKERIANAEVAEQRVKDFETQTSKLAAQNLALERKIEVLVMERDEARAMIAAREQVPPTIDFIDMASLPPSPAALERARKNQPAPPKASDPSDATDWYVPFSEP